MKHNPPAVKVASRAFTLIELLTVIAIIAVLMGLLFPAVGAAREAAKKTQAKSDMANVVNAVKAYYTEYGKYPCGAQTGGNDSDYYVNDAPEQSVLFNILQSQKVNGNYTTEQDTYNPRRVVFIELPMAKDPNSPKSGVGGNGRFYDPWGSCYNIRIDNNYDNSVENPYTSNAGFNPIATGVIAWSVGKDGSADSSQQNKKSGISNKNSGTAADDVLSWQ